MARRAKQYDLPLRTERKPHPGSVFERTPGHWYIRVRLTGKKRPLCRRAPAETRHGAQEYLDLVRLEYGRTGALPQPLRAPRSLVMASPEPCLL